MDRSVTARDGVERLTAHRDSGRILPSDATPAGMLLGRGVDYLVAARRRWRTSMGVLVVGAGLGVAVALLMPSRYPASASFVPDGDQSRGSLRGALAGLSATLGVPGTTESPQFYAELLVNRDLLSRVLYKEYPAETTGLESTARLIDTYDLPNPDTPSGREDGLRVLSNRISTSVDPRTGIVGFTVEAQTPQLAVALATDLLDGVNAMNLRLRHERASAQQRFMAGRVREAEDDLRAAEDELRRFLASNRTFQSPSLQFEQTRLERNVELRQTLYRTLREDLDRVSLDAARNTPSLLVLSEPMLITKRSHPKRRLIVAVALVASIVVLMTLLRVLEQDGFRRDEPGSGTWGFEVTRLGRLFTALRGRRQV